MGQNLQLKKAATQYANDDIDESEFIRKALEEIAYQHSTSFWSMVIRMKEQHDYTNQTLK